MLVGVVRAELELPDGGTLKDKRRVIQGLTVRVRKRFEVACAEVDRMDDHHRATLGIAMVSNDRRHIDAVMSRIETWLAGMPQAVLLDFVVEVT
jgi:hypothetical protein